MAGYRDEIYAEVDRQFMLLSGGKDFFNDTPVVDPTPYEIGQRVEPAGWVSNASSADGSATVTIDADGITILDGSLVIKDSSGNTVASDGVWQNGPGTVVIDADGITITNGALSLSDAFGNNVITGAGFGASWLDFISGGFYNGNFQVGTTNDIVGATEVSGADSDADYLASLSDDIPYWIVASESGAGSLQRVADSTAVGGFALRWNGTETAEIYQDIPVVPGQLYSIALVWRYTNSASDFDMTVGCQFRKSDHSVSATATIQETGLNYTTTQATYIRQMHNAMTLVAPSDARYLRVFIESARASGSPVVYLNGVTATPKLYLDTLNIGDYANSSAGVSFKAPFVGDFLNSSVSGDTSFRFLINHSGRLAWGSGSATEDAFLRRSGTKSLTFDSDGAGTDLTLISANTDQLKVPDGFISAIRSADGVTLFMGSKAGDTGPKLWLGSSGGGAGLIQFDDGSHAAGSGDTNLYRSAANTLKTDDSFTVAGSLVAGVSTLERLVLGGGTSAVAGSIGFEERAGIGNTAANQAVLYAKDNGAGKTQLVVVFSSGVTQVIATQP